MSAARSPYPLLGSPNPDCEVVWGKMTFTSAGGPVRAAGKGWVATKAATGVFDLEFSFPYKEGVGIPAMLDGSGNALQARFVSWTQSTRKMRFVVEDASGTDTDPSDGGGFVFVAVMQRSGLSAT